MAGGDIFIVTVFTSKHMNTSTEDVSVLLASVYTTTYYVCTYTHQ